GNGSVFTFGVKKAMPAASASRRRSSRAMWIISGADSDRAASASAIRPSTSASMPSGTPVRCSMRPFEVVAVSMSSRSAQLVESTDGTDEAVEGAVFHLLGVEEPGLQLDVADGDE